MSWKTAGKLLSGPPTTSNSNKLDSRFRPNTGGLNAFQRERQLTRYAEPEKLTEPKSEWDVLRENHRFIRDDEAVGDVSWEERLARAYESKLFKEFALIDLKHFKSKRLALRWRTAEEVVEGIGEDTCASLRCKYHQPPSSAPQNAMWEDDTPGPSISQRGTPYHGDGRRNKKSKIPPLRAFELPFVYEEAGERKEALVKVRLCPKCQAKLIWKPGKEDPDSEDDEGRASDKKEKERRHRSRRHDTSEEEDRKEKTSHRRERDRERDRRQNSSRPDPRSRTRSRSRSKSPSRHGRNLI